MAREHFPAILCAEEVMEPQLTSRTRRKTMGTAQAQGALWGVQAHNFAERQEGMLLPAYKKVFDLTNVGRGTRLLDVGCGPGLATQLAAKLGASVTGLDASEAELSIARERVPDGDFRQGEMEELPYADASFDVVTGFNSFQYADGDVGESTGL
ncbi:MAG: class I SAM-dependent methyltransferase [Chloroflexi bacterium]|nr:MAG: class I SAM-dependent methyltransferase [Chloroflexota bacterium]